MTNRLKAGLFCVALFLLIVFRGSSGPPMQFAPFMMGGQIITDWARRVVANGGAMPSQTSIIAMETLRVSLEAQSLTNKIYTLCIFVPDSVIAASTPLIKNKGSDPWTNSGFVSGDLNIQGLKGNGANFLDTGVMAIAGATNANQILTNSGISAIVTESATNEARAIILNQQFLTTENDRGLFASAGGIDQFYMGLLFSATVGVVSTNDFNRVGYLSGNRTDETNLNLYVASPIEAHKLLAARQASPNVDDGRGTNTTFAFYETRNAGTNNVASNLRLSMACLHQGLSQTESSNLWWAVYTCRQSLGGGTGDPIWDWARYVTNFGGAAISVGTSNALRTFRQGLDTDGLLYKMVAVNCYPTDNLTAARTPLIWQGGRQIWTNTAFGESNLTVNGLTGDGTSKYLGTGINPSAQTNNGFGDGSAGITEMIYANTSTASKVNMGAVGSSAGFQFSLYAAVTNSLNIQFYCWTIAGVNTNFLILPRQSNWVGYLSGNRVDSNTLALYGVTNGAHNTLTNGNNRVETGHNNDITNVFAHALANLSVPANISDQTVSFLALHSGLSQTQSSNLWYRVAILRTNLGGGVPP